MEEGKEMENKTIQVPLMSEVIAQGKEPEILFWIGCAGRNCTV